MTKEEVIEILERFVIGAKPCSQREIVDACASAYTMLKEQPSLPSNLDEAAQKVEDYYDVGEEHGYLCCHRGDIKDAFKAGAEWQIEQFEKNRLAACDAQTKEEYDMETAFVDKIIKEQHSTPTFSDAIKYGIEWMAGQGATMEITDDTEWADLDSFVHKNVTGGSIIQIRKK